MAKHVWVRRCMLMVACFLVSIPASAQYGGGGGAPVPGGSPSYGSSGAVIGVVAGVAAVAGVVFLVLHNQATVSGCVRSQGAGLTLQADDHKSYALPHPGALQAGQKVRLQGKRTKDAAGAPAFQVRHVKQLGTCS